MNLRTLFAIPIAVILLVALSLAGMLAGQGWSGQARGRAAVEAVEQMRLLLELQADLREERIITNLTLGKPHPLPEQFARQLAGVRRKTDLEISAAIARFRDSGGGEANVPPPELYVATVQFKLMSLRVQIDQLLSRGRNERSLPELSILMPRGLEVAGALDGPLERASLAVAAIDPGLAGLVTEDRLAGSLRDQVGLIAEVLLPRSGKGELSTQGDLDQVQALLTRTTYLTRLISDTIGIAGATERIRQALDRVKAIDADDIIRPLKEHRETATPQNPDDEPMPMPQRVLVPWGGRITALRTAIVDAMVERVAATRATRERQFDLVLVAFGVVVVAMLEAIFSLSQRVVNPLAQLGLAITRIAGGDRSVPLIPRSGTREIVEMMTAMETLRQAALVADAAAMRQRVAARHRLQSLREALGIVQTVREPAHALERGVASLAAGIDATIALVNAAASALPPTLDTAANAVRVGLAEMRESAAGLDATFAAANDAQMEDRPAEEFVAHILAVQVEVDRRDMAVRRFVQPSLMALRDAAGMTREPRLRDLVSDQFQSIEATVATMAAMRSAMARAATIVREMPLEVAPMAA